MNDDVDYLELVSLVTEAKRGDQASMSRLAEMAEERLLAYIYRLTLNYDLAQDLLQETLLKMVESLKELRRADRFWAWLFRTALGKVQHHFREQKHKRTVQASAFAKERLLKHSSQNDDGLSYAIREELSDAIFEAMARLKLRHRNILILRCFEQMPYSEIAEFLGCKELRVRVMFFRAKYSLKQQLSHHGFSKAMLLTALGFFGLITGPAKTASATCTISTASLEVGSAAAVAIGFLGTKLGILIATSIGAMTFAVAVKAFLVFVVLVFVALTFVCVGLFSR